MAEDYKFASDYAREQALVISISEAAKEWRLADRAYQLARSQWTSHIVDEKYEEMALLEKVRDGYLAKLTLLTDRLITE